MASPLTTRTAPPNSFVIPDRKIAYLSVTKAACTSLRWMVADLSGEDLASFPRSTGATQTQLMTIHGGRERWKKTPTLGELGAEALSAVHPDNGWFVFAVVRDPWSRLWSAWQSKFLVQHGKYLRDYADEPFYPRVPTSAGEVIEDFRQFAVQQPWRSHPLLSTDTHFRTQSAALALDVVPYSRVYDVHTMPELLADVHQHLAALGRDQELYVPRANETPLPPVRDLFDDEVRRSVEDAYAADFEAFPGRWTLDQVRFVDSWSDDALANVRAQVAANERIGALSTRAREFNQERKEVAALLRDTERQLADARRRAADLESEPLWHVAARRAKRRARRWLPG
ncbi:hypothetical protein GCM10009718_30790 [Isoptericola halotolerans]|uniref:Sulfotransferase family protein n=1 Tax=Isoptericola halotolerans TaxID=300560 RepID=A0ABX2A440_9MICO|nr:sulfotransferase family 2 domain-containing protein [Isoptericola halotolerans]NOV97583.1 hypothetical protein [Isoptericola halotolerans]